MQRRRAWGRRGTVTKEVGRGRDAAPSSSSFRPPDPLWAWAWVREREREREAWEREGEASALWAWARGREERHCVREMSEGLEMGCGFISYIYYDVAVGPRWAEMDYEWAWVH